MNQRDAINAATLLRGLQDNPTKSPEQIEEAVKTLFQWVHNSTRRFEYYWVKFKTKPAGCIQARGKEEAEEWAKRLRGDEVHSVETLPYPASPVIWQFAHPVHGACPDFCHDPGSCKGRTACPKNPCCTS